MANGADGRKTCFVVMGFGQKTDYQANPPRVLDLNRTFEDIIQPAVEACGVECVRADKIIHSTVIDKPMYERLLAADIVVADLSTSNPNAIYELGVRHALRPHTTIVMAEENFAFPFDLNHVSILKYAHLGKEIGFREVMRVREELKAKIAELVDKGETDSPVFLFLPQLLGAGAEATPAPAATAAPQDEKSLGDLMESVRQAKSDVKAPEDWLLVVALLNRLRKIQPHDAHIVQELALATYKSKQPDAAKALEKARVILEELGPETSSDAETVGLWGAIHKRLWEAHHTPGDLDRAIRAYARGYLIKNDYYNGINYAFLLNVRAAASQDDGAAASPLVERAGVSRGEMAVADRVLARRVRAEVLALCDLALESQSIRPDEAFWVRATKVEALTGLGRAAEAEALRKAISAGQPPGDGPAAAPVRPAAEAWMVDSMNEQLAKLSALNP